MAWWLAHMPTTVCTTHGTARTPDGYVFYRQPDGSGWCDIDGGWFYTSRSALERDGAVFSD